jgi:nitrate/nitrite transporter NarK
MTVGTVLSLLAVHFVADFVLQSDWMASNKSKRWDALTLHTSIYALCFLWWGLPFIWITFVAHTAQDWLTSRINSRFWFFEMQPGIWAQAEYAVPKHGRTIVNPWTPIEGKRHWFFVGIGADQLLHFVQLVLTWQLLN